jgi:hypothetical protein
MKKVQQNDLIQSIYHRVRNLGSIPSRRKRFIFSTLPKATLGPTSLLPNGHRGPVPRG